MPVRPDPTQFRKADERIEKSPSPPAFREISPCGSFIALGGVAAHAHGGRIARVEVKGPPKCGGTQERFARPGQTPRRDSLRNPLRWLEMS
jgi:hypothetical protein